MSLIDINVIVDTETNHEKIYFKLQKGEDKGRRLCISIYKNGLPFLVEGIKEFRLQFDKKDGTSVIEYVTSTNDSSDPYYTYDSTNGYTIFYKVPISVTSVGGDLKCKVSIISSNGDILKTCLFKGRVDDGMIDEDKIVFCETTNGVLERIEQLEESSGVSIDDNTTSSTTTWSSSKINDKFASLRTDVINADNIIIASIQENSAQTQKNSNNITTLSTAYLKEELIDENLTLTVVFSGEFE